ncbi:MAG: hypothetical protein EAZ89_10190, partial [Bacteroidetes bacterium]
MWVCLLAGLLTGANAQVFTDVTSTAIPSLPPSVTAGVLTWGDFEQSGNPAFLISGETSTAGTYLSRVYRRPGATFANFTGASTLPQLRRSAAAWGDYDEDGDLDLIICGEDNSGTRISKIFRFNGTSFVEDGTASPQLTSVTNGAVAWGDYDNDGDLDLALMGRSGTSTTVMNIYLNDVNGSGGFSLLSTPSLIGLENGSIEWGDYDIDGDLDLLATGADVNGNPATRVYINTGLGFSVLTTNLPNLKNSHATWGDYDNDGDPDILLCGENAGGTLQTGIFRNDNSNIFPEVVTLTGIRQGMAVWGDYNNDRLPDVLLTGQNGALSTDRVTELWRNDPSGTFVQVADNFPDLNGGARAAFGDYDNDKKIDVLLSGIGASGYVFRLFKNTDTNPIQTPGAPQSLQAQVQGATVNLTWQRPAGFSSALAKGLTYNLYIGTTPLDDNVRPAMANTSTGVRRISGFGAIADTAWRVSGLSNGTYYWGVQTIDADFEGSAFVAGSSFVYSSPVSAVSSFADETSSEFSPVPSGVYNASVSWADTDRDGDLDFIASGLVSDAPLDVRTNIFQNNGTGNFTDLISANSLPELRFTDLVWGDLDNDNDADLILTGRDAQGSANRVTKVYINNGSGQFVDNSTASNSLVQVGNGSVDLADYDRDGDLDVLITGNAQVGAVGRVYKNQLIPSGSLTFVLDASLEGITDSDAAFGDYNQDGWPDIALAGQNSSNTPVTKIYQNNAGVFTENTGAGLLDLYQSSIAWGDVNNDGYPDLAINGFYKFGAQDIPSTNVYRVEPQLGFSFQQLPASELRPRGNGSVSLADYNNDGFRDLLVTGDSADKSTTDIYLNNANPSASNFLRDLQASATLTDVGQGSSAAFGDYDGDKKPDILLTGRQSSGTNVLKLFRNINTSTNLTPGPPIKLLAQLDGYNVTLSWDPPANIPATQADGLTYALYVGGPGLTDSTNKQSPLSRLSNGYRRVVEAGKAGQKTQFTLSGLTPGTYRWSVQAIDQDFEGSAFAAQQSFEFENPIFLDSTETLFEFASYLSGLRESAVAWGDYTGDGLLDIAVCGRSNDLNYFTGLYTYDASQNRFAYDASNSAALADVRNGSVAWGDYDNDGDLDLLLTGESSGGLISRVYKSTNGVFGSTGANIINLDITVKNGKGIWADYDIDGYRDILLTGEDVGGNRITRIYRNTVLPATAPFVNAAVAGLDALRYSAADFGDYDKDGYPDLLLTGESASGAVSKLFRNNTNGGFTQVNIAGLPAVQKGSVQWGDYNADGLLDFLIAGETSSGRVLRVYRNDGAGVFTSISNSFTGISRGAARWGDYNSDGYLDIAAVGQNGPNDEDRGSFLYRYNPLSSSFEDEFLAAAAFRRVNGGADLAWGDYNRDKKLDLLIVGQESDPASGAFRLCRNIDLSPVSTPDAPTALTVEVSGYEVRLRWTAPANIPAAVRKGLSYNVYIGTSAGGIQRRSPEALRSAQNNGRRQVVFKGQVSDTTAFRIKNLPAGTYFWAVQAIDADFEGSVFATATQSFNYEPPTFLDHTSTAFASLPSGLSEGALAWADFDNDGDLDLAAAGESATGPAARLYQNTAGVFAEISAGWIPLSFADLAWADIDNDNDPDLIICGESGGVPATHLYRNDGGAFVLLSTSLPQVSRGSIDWADIDKDGDMDLLLTGDTGAGFISEVYKNNGAGVFTALGAGLTPVKNGDAAFADINKDGFADFVLTGATATGRIIQFYRNNRNAGFVAVSSTIDANDVDESSLDWADINGDGFPDLLLSGQLTNSGSYISSVYVNDGTGVLTALPLGFASGNGSVAFADYNSDGLSDLVISGQTSAAQETRLYRNVSGTSFVRQQIAELPFTDVRASSLAWGDFDGNKKTDLALMGLSASGRVLKIYKNIEPTANTTPLAPSALTATQVSDTVVLSWTAPLNSAGYSYNLYVGSAPGQTQKSTPLAVISNGYQKVAREGNNGFMLTYKLLGLTSGTYFWSVQAVDEDFEGSAFASEQSFTYTKPAFTNTSPVVLPAGISGFSEGSLHWADYDNDGDIDLFVSGEINNNDTRSSIFENVGGVFTRDALASADLDSLYNSQADWGDYDNDGDLDLALCGHTPAGLPRTYLYVNNGSGRFTNDLRGNVLPELTAGTLKWGDYDNDGDLDLFVSGRTQGAPGATAFSAVFRNNNISFVRDTVLNITALENSSADWGDFDKDGDLDLAV